MLYLAGPLRAMFCQFVLICVDCLVTESLIFQELVAFSEDVDFAGTSNCHGSFLVSCWGPNRMGPVCDTLLVCL